MLGGDLDEGEKELIAMVFEVKPPDIGTVDDDYAGMWQDQIALEVGALVVVVPPPNLIDQRTQGFLVQCEEEPEILGSGRTQRDLVHAYSLRISSGVSTTVPSSISTK